MFNVELVDCELTYAVNVNFLVRLQLWLGLRLWGFFLLRLGGLLLHPAGLLFLELFLLLFSSSCFSFGFLFCGFLFCVLGLFFLVFFRLCFVVFLFVGIFRIFLGVQLLLGLELVELSA